MWLSSRTHTTSPAARMTASARARSVALTDGGANKPVAPAPTSAGRFGIVRTTGRLPPAQLSSAATSSPAHTEMSSGCIFCSTGASGARTLPASWGLTASTTIVASATAAALSAVAEMPKSRPSAARAGS